MVNAVFLIVETTVLKDAGPVWFGRKKEALPILKRAELVEESWPIRNVTSVRPGEKEDKSATVPHLYLSFSNGIIWPPVLIPETIVNDCTLLEGKPYQI